MVIKKVLQILLLGYLAGSTVWAETTSPSAFDHGRWGRLLAAHVIPSNGGQATVVDYQGMKLDQPDLEQYLNALSAVSGVQFNQWPKKEQLAFLINTYNAFTVALILSAWPDLESIKDLGSIFRSPWRREFVPLLGATRSLDDIEHGLIRGSGRYNDPRIHFAVNCASIGCPALRAEAYEGSSLDRQLDEQTALFLADRSRNRVDADSIKLSSIFKWYRGDFEKGWRGFNRLEDFLLVHADDLGLSTAMAEKLGAGDADIEYLDYDWRLNKQ